jgi:hypothetical protein
MSWLTFGAARSSLNLPVILALLALLLLGHQVEAVAQQALPTVPGMGLYTNFADQICGKQGIIGGRWNPKELPWIGCFGLSIGNGATGTISDHRIEVAVDTKGEEVCKIDGAAVPCQGCIDQDHDCSTMLTVISRNTDKSVFLYFAKRVNQYAYVTNQENWEDFQKINQR